MKAPEGLEPLLDYGIIQEVVRPLMSGKEAQVYVVDAAGQTCVAKVYKEATQRTFRHRADYTEGRRTRNTRDQRAISKRTRHGRKKDEDAWRSAEVDMLYRLRDAGVRVPAPINFVEGVLVMELVVDADGNPAPRLGDLSYTPEEARDIYQKLLRDTIRMLCAGVIHGDLSEFNVLMGAGGPVVIDFPQAVDPTKNRNGEKLFLRDIDNLHRFLARFAPDDPVLPYGQEIWSLYQSNRLVPDTKLTGRYRAPRGKTDTREVMALIEDAQNDRNRRRGRTTERDEAEDFDGDPRARVDPADSPPPLRRVVDFSADRQPRPARKRRATKPEEERSSNGRTRRPRSRTGASTGTATPRDTTSRPARKRKPATRSSSGTGASAKSKGAARSRKDGVAPSRDEAEKAAREAKGSALREGDAAPRKRRRRGRRSANQKTEATPASRPTAPKPAAQATRPKTPAAPARPDGDRPKRRRRRRPARRNASE